MIKPTEKDIGRKVFYTGNHYPGDKPEFGVITSYNEHNIFVRYGTDIGSQSTSPDDLEWDT